jgi:hypothetical protein
VKAIEVGPAALTLNGATSGLTVGSITTNSGDLTIAATNIEVGSIGGTGDIVVTGATIKASGNSTTGTFQFSGADQILVKPSLSTTIEATTSSTLTLGGGTLKGALTLGNTAVLETTAPLQTAAASGAITLGASGGTFTPTGAITFPAGTTFNGSPKTIELGGELTIGTGVTSLEIGGAGKLVGDVKLDGGSSKTVVLTGATITAANSAAVTLTRTDAVVNLGAGTKIEADEITVTNGTTGSVRLTNITYTATAAATTAFVGNTGVVTVEDTNILELGNEGIITVTGTGSKVTLPNTEFGVGTYTATGKLTITAGTSEDTIETGDAAGDGLKYGSGGNDIAFTATSASDPATYTLTQSDSGSNNKIVFAEISSVPTITIPVGSGTGADLKIPAEGTVVIGQGTNGGAIVLKFVASYGGTLTLEANSAIKGIKITNAASNGTDINITGITVTATAAADIAEATSNGTLTATTGGGGTFKATAAEATINKNTTATIGSS